MSRRRPPAISEAQLQANVVDTAKLAGFLYFHDKDSRRNPRGLPDLILVHPGTGRLVFVELKSATGKVRPDQRVWLAALGIRHEVYLWRPADWMSGEIQRVLLGRRIAVAAGAPARPPSAAAATMGA